MGIVLCSNGVKRSWLRGRVGSLCPLPGADGMNRSLRSNIFVQGACEACFSEKCAIISWKVGTFTQEVVIVAAGLLTQGAGPDGALSDELWALIVRSSRRRSEC